MASVARKASSPKTAMKIEPLKKPISSSTAASIKPYSKPISRPTARQKTVTGTGKTIYKRSK